MTVGTPFHLRTAPLNRKLAWEEWQGYHAASLFADFHDIEYNAIRESVGAIDVSPLFKYLVSGPDAPRLIDRIITRDATKLQVDQIYYTPWCDERGKVIDDGTITRLGETSYRWTAAEPNLRWLEMNGVGLDVAVEDVTDELAALAIQGPRARDLLQDVTGENWSDVRYYRRRPTRIAGVEVDVTRTGYTGDLGYELWILSGDAVAVWDALFERGEAHGLRPVGMRAMDVARVEAGLILIDAEYTGSRWAVSAEQEYSPFEIGLGRLVNLMKLDFVGRRPLVLEEAAGGPSRRLVGLAYDWDGIEAAFAEHGLPPTLLPETTSERTPLRRGRHQVGRVTSRTWSPMLKRVIALASVSREHAAEGTRLRAEWTVEGHRHQVAATVVPLPFLDLPRKRA
jgi:glycine cleavage system T protein (aminomethyltransferase)